MNPPRILLRIAPTIGFIVALAMAVGCGSSNSNGTTSSGPVAAFTPDTSTPGPTTVALLSGSSSGAAVNIRVTVTGVPVFFGAAFRIKYDPTALLFNSMDTTGSFLRTGVTDADVFFMEDHVTIPGEVVLVATRVNPSVAGPVAVGATSDLLVVNFVARKAIAAAAAEGRLDFEDPKQVCDGTVAPPGCGAVTVTWSGGGFSAQ